MKLAVTGCNGSVGSRIVLAALAEGHTIVGIDSVPIPKDFAHLLVNTSDAHFTFYEADIGEYDAALRLLKGCEGVLHLAAIPTPGDYVVATHNANVVTSWSILRAAAELGIARVAQASSVNVIPLAWTERKDFKYFPLDEYHPTRPDEPYGLSKLICEMQADTIVRRYPSMRVASLRLSWSVPDRAAAMRPDPAARKTDLWGYVQEDSAAEAFLLAVAGKDDKWNGHERFFIVAPDAASNVPSMKLWEMFWQDVPFKRGKELSGTQGFFDCSKAEKLLGWVHRSP